MGKMARVKLKSERSIVKILYKEVHNLLFDYKYIPITAFLILLVEIAINAYTILRVNYTEIDWIAYMQEVEGFLNGTTDYSKLKGDTGPLVYPAGFVYIFSGFYFITNKGKNIRLAQYLYFALYLLMLFLLYRIYNISKKVPPYVLIISCCISYRIHSIFLLRLFNDPIAMLFFYVSINLFVSDKWTLGSIFYSLAVSIKMNILLYSPALLAAYVTILGIKDTVKQISICALVQLLLGLPFLLSNPVAYLKQSFNLGRVFFHQWTVNWRFLPENIFVNPYFHLILLCVHLILLIVASFSWSKLLSSYTTLRSVEKSLQMNSNKYKEKVDMSIMSQLFFLPFFMSNFIGIVCSRSLHYQFYVWYYHTLPYMLWCTPYSDKIRLTILGIIELCWNIYPSTSTSSTCLHICHLTILYGLFKNIRKLNKKTQ